MTLSPVAKAIVAFIVGLVGFIAQLVGDDTFSREDTISLVQWLVATFAVYFVPNKPAYDATGTR